MEARLATPFGHIVVVEHGGRLHELRLRPSEAPTTVPPRFPRRLLDPLRAYFEGRVEAPHVAVETGGTPFERQVWQSLPYIPPGRPITYGELAERLERPGAARAVGQALRKNPLPIVWPCHRVVAHDGLGGFGGASRTDHPRALAQLEIKRWLLEHEARHAGVAVQQALVV